jgi:predicted NBD/HSP70 family sugar kinase
MVPRPAIPSRPRTRLPPARRTVRPIRRRASSRIRLVRAGDQPTSAARALAIALGWLVCLLDPSALVLGGGLSQAAGLWAESLAVHTERAVVSRSGPPPLLRAELGADAGLIGAATLAARP